MDYKIFKLIHHYLLSISLILSSDKLSRRFDKESCINLQLSLIIILYLISLSLYHFLNGTVKLIYFSVFSPKHSELPLNFLAKYLIMK